MARARACSTIFTHSSAVRGYLQARCGPADELVGVERVGVTLGVQGGTELGRQLAHEVEGLTPVQSLRQRREGHLRGALGRRGVDAQRVLDDGEELLVVHRVLSDVLERSRPSWGRPCGAVIA
jgi:hypothetical protein